MRPAGGHFTTYQFMAGPPPQTADGGRYITSGPSYTEEPRWELIISKPYASLVIKKKLKHWRPKEQRNGKIKGFKTIMHGLMI
jgi:hypothetical protein